MGVEPVVTNSGARRALRKLELEAYAAVVSAFRAQGPLTKDKKSSLDFLSKLLGISTERHRAEIRRAVNDELLGSVAGCLTGYDTDKAWRKEGQKLATTNPRFVSRPATHIPQVLTAATLSAGAAGVGLKAGGATTTKATPTSGQATELDLKKAISIQLQNALKLVMSQNPTASATSSRATSVTQDSKTLTTSLLPQSAPVTPVKTSTSSTVTLSSSKAASSSTLSPLKAGGTVTCKLTTAKVVPSSSPRKNIGVGTSPSTSAVTAIPQAAKTKGGSSSNMDSASKKSKLSAIESLLCEETISPKNSPGSASNVVKDEVPMTPPERDSPVTVKRAEVLKTEMEKKEPTEVADTPKVEPPADSQKAKRPGNSQNIEPPVDSSKTEPSEKVDLPADSQQIKPPDAATGVEEGKNETKSTKNIEIKPTDDVDAKPTQDTETRPTISIEVKPTTDKLSTGGEERSTEPCEKKPLPSSDIHVESDEKAKPLATVTSDSTVVSGSPPMEQTNLVENSSKQNVDKVSPMTNNEVVKTETTGTSPTHIQVSKPKLLSSATPTAPQKEDVTVKKLPRKRSPSPSLNESDQPPPPKKQAIAPQKDTAIPPSSSPASTTTAVPSTTVTSTTTTATQAPVITTSTVTITVLESPMEVVTQGATSTPDFSITATPSQLPTEVNTDSLIQSLCSDSTSFEDPDVTVLASQLGLDSVDSPIFNLSGFLSLIQPDLSVLTPEEQSPSISGQPLGDASSSADQKHPEEMMATENTSSNSEIQTPAKFEPLSTPDKSETTTATSFPVTQTLPVGITSLQSEVAVPIPSAAPELAPSPSQQPPTISSASAPPASLQPLPESSITTSTSVLSPVMFPEEPVPPLRPLMLGISTDVPNLNQTPPPSLGTPVTPTPLPSTPLTPLGEGLLDLSDIRSLVDESEAMEGISQDVFESIEKLVNLDEQSTNATWK